jgi:hypothetical protein
VKYLCLEYQPAQEAAPPPPEACAAYEESLWKRGMYVYESISDRGLESTTSLQFDAGHVTVEAGAMFATPAPLRGVMVIEADDLNHAIRLMSQSPRMLTGGGTIEIRPIEDDGVAPRRSSK